MNFEFAIANLIIFGPGRFREIGDIAQSFGKRAQPFTGALIQDGIQFPVLEQLMDFPAHWVENILFPMALPVPVSCLT